MNLFAARLSIVACTTISVRLRRDVLVTGKYLSGLVTSIILFTTVT